MTHKLFLSLALIAGLAACGSAQSDGLTVSREEFGDAWPFTVSEGRVFCRVPSQALFEAGGRVYPLNGLASARSEQEGYAALESIWRSNPAIPGTRVSISGMIDVALEQC